MCGIWSILSVSLTAASTSAIADSVTFSASGVKCEGEGVGVLCVVPLYLCVCILFSLSPVSLCSSSTFLVLRLARALSLSLHALRSAYKGSQILSMVPEPPSRAVSFFSKNTPKFVQERRTGLQQWMRSLITVPRAAENSDVTGLLGLFEKTRESSVLFAAPPLGLTIQDRDGHVVVVDFKDNKDGSPGAAEASGKVALGDRCVWGVCGVCLLCFHLAIYQKKSALVVVVVVVSCGAQN